MARLIGKLGGLVNPRARKRPMPPTVPPRLHAILARRAPVGVVFRRGPSREVATLLWDRRDDSFRPGQWLRGVIYARRGDLSPDGRHMILFAGRHARTGRELDTWTAVSRTPWLRAEALWAKGDAWQGGGWFLNDRDYWLNGCHRELRRAPGLQRVPRDPVGPQSNHECLGLYLPRLVRDGWELHLRTSWRAELSRTLPRGWRLHKLVHAGAPAPGRGVYWEEHLVESTRTGEVLARPGWEWADRCGPDIVHAEAGALWRQTILSPERLGPPRLLRDFGPMRFEAVAAPG